MALNNTPKVRWHRVTVSILTVFIFATSLSHDRSRRRFNGTGVKLSRQVHRTTFTFAFILSHGCRLGMDKSWFTLTILEQCEYVYPNGPEAGREAGWGSEFVPLKKRQVGSFILLHKISRTACCFGIRTFLKQYNCYESATNWYTDHQYLAQYSDIINNLQEIPLIFCNYAVRSCGTWRKGPGQSPCNGLSISDLELYVTETSTGVCDPVTD